MLIGSLLLPAAGAGALLTGCSQAARQPAGESAFQPVGVWYSVETAASTSRDLPGIVDRDFASIARMGMNAVFIRHCDPDDLPLVLEAAAKHRLKSVVSDPAALRYLRSAAPQTALLTPTDDLPSAQPIAALYLGRVVDDETLQRACRIAAAAKHADPPLPTCVTIETSSVSLDEQTVFDYPIWLDPSADSDPPAVGRWPAGGIHRVPCLQHRKDELATVRQWLAGYHLGLLRGRTGGVVFDAYRALPGNWRGVVRQDQPPSPERTAMLRRIAGRVQTWGELLDGLHGTPLRSLRAHPLDLEAALLASDNRRCLMIVNKSPTRFVRTKLAFAASLGRTTVQRAVAVATAEDTMLGPVLHARHGELIVPVELAPGEAKLYELF